jgi:type IV pilus assembly protein PilM
MLEERMSVPVKLSEPFKVFNVGRKVDRIYLAENAPVYAVATGLSIRRPGDK